MSLGRACVLVKRIGFCIAKSLGRAGKRYSGRKKSRRLRQAAFFAILFWGMWRLRLTGLQALAAEETVAFGAGAYAWNIGEVNTLEVTFREAGGADGYTICLEYDPAVIEYLDGADRAEGKRLWLEGEGGETEYVRTLLFRPRAAGNTVIRAVAAERKPEGTEETAGKRGESGETEGERGKAEEAPGKRGESEETEEERGGAEETAGKREGLGEEGKRNEPEDTAVRLPQASVAAQEAGSRLQRLEVGFAAGMEPFSPAVLEYHMQVGYEVEWLPMEYETEDEAAEVTVSGENLKVGSNVITLAVQKGQAAPVVYTLYVEREEKPEELLPGGEETEPQELSESNVEPGKMQETEQGKIQAEPAGMQETEPAEAGVGDSSAVSPAGGNGPQGSGSGQLLLCVAFLAAGGPTLFFFLWRKRRSGAGRNGQEGSGFQMINLDKTVIDVRHVTMNFRLAQDEPSSLKEYFIKALKRQNHYRVFSALKDINFEVKQGEVLGVIGTNGSGKSTLLKIIAGALIPSKGKVVVDKNKVHMLTLGTGFDMELTARENVYLNGAIIGYTKEYIDEKYEDIVTFAELEGFMEERMKNFSSGMVSRLGFAIATVRDSPDILILDEVLSVGDMFFRKKSEQRIQEMIHSGATVLIVSHSSDFIRQNCDTVVWIEKGVMKMIGKPEEVCKAYGQMEK